MQISIIHPSRNRPLQAVDTARNWLNKAYDKENIEYILSLDTDEREYMAYETMFMKWCPALPALINWNNNHSAIDAINSAATKASGDLLVIVSDDFDCPMHWDKLLLDALQDKEDFIVKTSDLANGINGQQEQPWIITLPIMDRKYYERFGYVYPPHILHMFADTWMTHVADLLDRKITLPIVFPHMHYTTGLNAKDDVNKKADSTWSQGEKAYLEGIANNFGLSDSDINGTLQCDDGHKHWLKTKGIVI